MAKLSRRPEKKRNALAPGLGEKIYLDRYALKDVTRSTLTTGDTVIVLTDPKTNQREIGTITRFNDGDTIDVELRDETRMTVPIEHIDKPLELEPGQMMDRVARGIASVERDEGARNYWQGKFREAMEEWKFVPAGRILTAAGSDQNLTLYNCYVIPSPQDSRAGIFKTLSQMTEIMSRGGGVGINLSSLRPQHAYVKGVNGRSSGSVSWGAVYSFVTGLIEQGGCFGPAERIATDKGLIPARELVARIESGERFQAQTHKGWRDITAKFRNGTKPIFQVTTARGFTVTVTAEHKMAVLREGAITTVPLAELEEGEEILLLLGQPSIESEFSLPETPYERSIMSTMLNTDVHLPTTLSADLAYLIGYMHGDGYVVPGKKVTWTAPKGIKMATADSHPEIREKLIEACRNVFHVNPIVENGDGACKNVTIYSRMIVEHLIAHGLLKAKAEEIRVPEAIFRSPSTVMLSFIAGYFDADGCNRGRKGGYGIDSISKAMLQDVQQLLAFNGILSHISTTDRSADGWQTIHRLTITGADFKQRFTDLVDTMKKGDNHGTRDMYNTYPAEVWTNLGARSKYRQRIYDGVSTRISHRQLGAIQARLEDDNQFDHAETLGNLRSVMPDTIVAIEPCGTSEVFDFEVDDVHLLSGNGVYTSNSRRGALMLILNDWHPDIMNFITSKREKGKITNANISVAVSDALMEAVKQDADWDLIFPDTSHPDHNDVWNGNLKAWQESGRPVIRHKTIKARKLWYAIVESAWASAEPGLFFIDRYNAMSNSWYFDYISCTNPCGEQGLPAWGVCNLGAINLAKFYKDGDVDWTALGDTVHTAVRFLDNVIDATPYFFEENYQQQQSERRVGLNTMGIAELLIRMGIRYGSDESVQFIDRLYDFIARESYQASIDLAKERGAFPEFKADEFLQSGYMQSMPQSIRSQVAEHGIRNVTLLTQAPNGTIGTMVGTSTGIEPFYSWTYYRKSRLGLHEQNVPIVDEWKEEHPGQELPDFFVNAMELTPEEHVKVEAAIQRWVDSSISKTCNVPNEYSIEDVGRLYEYMYELGCKGGTVYRDGSRDEQVLMLKVEEPKTAPAVQSPPTPALKDGEKVFHFVHAVAPLPKRRQGMTTSTATPLGTVHVTTNHDEHGEPFEVFFNIGKAGSDLQADAEALGRLISLQLRIASPLSRLERLNLIINQLEGIGGSRSIGFGPNRVHSLADAVAQVLRQIYFDEKNGNGHVEPLQIASSSLGDTASGLNEVADLSKLSHADLCPNCGMGTFIREEGCKKCLSCGHSEC